MAFSMIMQRNLINGFAAILILPLVFGLPANAQEPASQQQWAQAVNRTLSRYLMLPAGTAELQGDQMVWLRMTVDPDGKIRNVKIEQSSGHANVDQAALRMVKRAGKLPPFSRDMEKKDLAVILPVHMKIMPPMEKDLAPPEPRKDRYVLGCTAPERHQNVPE